MSFFALLIALLLEQKHPFPGVDRLSTLLGKWADYIQQRFNTGQDLDGRAAWCVAVLPLVFAVWGEYTLLTYGLGGLWGALDWLFQVAVLYALMGFRQESHFFSDIQKALQTGDISLARSVLGQWRGEDHQQASQEEIARLSIEEGILAGYRNVFALLFWFMVLPGVSGVVFYYMTRFLAQHWSKTSEEPTVFSQFSRRVLAFLDFFPTRLAAWSFMIVGDFEDAKYCKDTQAQTWSDPLAGVLLACAAGALGIRLGGMIHQGAVLVDRPTLGLEEEATVNAMQRTAGLMWRALLLCLMCVALFDLIGWAGLVALGH